MVQRNEKLRYKIIKFYDDLLLEECGIGWRNASRVLSEEIGNESGVYPDTLLLMIKMIKYFNLKQIVEYGAGMSTLFLSKTCIDLNIPFISYEENRKWLRITQKLLDYYNYPTKICWLKSPPLLIDPYPSLVFIDCSPELRLQLLEVSKSHPHTEFIIVDDANSMLIGRRCARFTHFSERPYYLFNGTGRTDRHQFISYRVDLDFNKFLSKEMNYL